MGGEHLGHRDDGEAAEHAKRRVGEAEQPDGRKFPSFRLARFRHRILLLQRIVSSSHSKLGAVAGQAQTPQFDDKVSVSVQVTPMLLRVLQPGTPEYRDSLKLREDVLRKPLALQLTAEELARDAACFHLGSFDGAQLRAVLLLQPVDEHVIQMRQVAVCAELQKTGVGSQLIAFAEEFARQKGYSSVLAHARGTALGFYLRLGYTAVGEQFMETTLPHRLVTKLLRDATGNGCARKGSA